MKRLILVIAFLLLLSSIAALSETGFEFFLPDSPGLYDNIQIGEPVSVDASFAFTATSFDYETSIGFYQAGTADVGSSEDYYNTEEGTQFAILKADIDNLDVAAFNYLENCEIKVFDEKNTYGGWAFQQNFNNSIMADLSYGKDSERQNTNWVINKSDVFAIEPSGRGHYVFGCTLPNDVVNKNTPLRMEITIRGTNLIFYIRKEDMAPNTSAQSTISTDDTCLDTFSDNSYGVIEDTTDGIEQEAVYEALYFEPLSKGSKGGQVVSLQRVLIALGYLNGSADGDYGEKTEAAVQSAQAQAGLPETGVADSSFLSELYSGKIPDARGSSLQPVVQVISYSETSHHTEKAGAYTVGNVFDGKTYTCWAEGVSGYGIGEGISFTVATFGRSSITLKIYSGYHKSSERYFQNGRPKEITLYVDGIPQTHMFSDAMSPEEIQIYGLEGHPFVELSISIESVYEGSKWKDTCISEIEVY